MSASFQVLQGTHEPTFRGFSDEVWEHVWMRAMFLGLENWIEDKVVPGGWGFQTWTWSFLDLPPSAEAAQGDDRGFQEHLTWAESKFPACLETAVLFSHTDQMDSLVNEGHKLSLYSLFQLLIATLHSRYIDDDQRVRNLEWIARQVPDTNTFLNMDAVPILMERRDRKCEVHDERPMPLVEFIMNREDGDAIRALDVFVRQGYDVGAVEDICIRMAQAEQRMAQAEQKMLDERWEFQSHAEFEPIPYSAIRHLYESERWRYVQEHKRWSAVKTWLLGCHRCCGPSQIQFFSGKAEPNVVRKDCLPKFV